MVADIEIVHGIPLEDADPWTATMRVTFLETADGPDFDSARPAREHTWVPDRHWGARANGRWVATLATLERTLTVPGSVTPLATVAADALTQVTVLATHRRRGLLTAMLSDSLQTARDRGDVVSILMAAEATIYGRFGYAPAERTARYTLRTRRRGCVPPVATDGGQLRLVDAEEFGALAPAVFAAAAGERAGNINRPERWWDRVVGRNGVPYAGARPNYVLRTGPTGPDGYLAWRPAVPPDHEYGTVVVEDFAAANDQAYRALWHYLATMDLVDRVNLERRPVEEPIGWLLPDPRTLCQTGVEDGLWLRLLDVPAALSARRYSTTGQLVIEVNDADIGGYAQGRFALDAGPTHAACTRAPGRRPDVTVSQRALAALYLGGFTLRAQAIAGLVEEHTSGAVAVLDAMFATSLPPWCSTDF